MAELVDAHDSKSCGEIHESSILSRGTSKIHKMSSSEAYKNFFKLATLPFLVYFTNDLVCRFFFPTYVKYGIDTYFHFAGGLSIAYTTNYFFILLEKAKFIEIKRKLARAFLIISTVAFVAVLWEVYEFVWDLSFGTHFQPSNFDTMKDLIMGTLGGISFCLIFLRTKATDGARERNALTDMLSTSNPAYNPLESDSETRMRD